MIKQNPKSNSSMLQVFAIFHKSLLVYLDRYCISRHSISKTRRTYQTGIFAFTNYANISQAQFLETWLVTRLIEFLGKLLTTNISYTRSIGLCASNATGLGST